MTHVAPAHPHGADPNRFPARCPRRRTHLPGERLRLPSGDGRSQQISTFAGQQLAQQALAAQSANIDGVSGATYTSDSYKTSLQSALDQLHTGTTSPASA